jgi:methyl-accepting chemotaxis protein
MEHAMESFCYPAVYVLFRLGLGRKLVLLGGLALLPLLVLGYAHYQLLGQPLAAEAVAGARRDLLLFVAAVAVLVAYLLAGQFYGARAAARGREPASAGEFAPLLGQMARQETEQRRAQERTLAAVDEVSSAAGELAVMAEDSAEGSRQQETAVNSIASAIEEMAASIREIEQQAEHTRLSSERANTLAVEGEAVVQDAVKEMAGIDASVQQSAQLIAQLAERSRQIDSIIHAIEAISDQTNLLALNAAIEAARAGEHGRGFSVVADEVRTLAQRSHDAAAEVAGQIEKIQAEIAAAVSGMGAVTGSVEQGVAFIQRAGDSLQAIKTGTAETLSLIATIAAAVTQQGAVSDEISGHIAQINLGAHRQNAIMAEVASAADYLAGLSGQVRGAEA